MTVSPMWSSALDGVVGVWALATGPDLRACLLERAA